MNAGRALLLAAVMAMGTASGASAVSFRIDAVDTQSQYTGFTPTPVANSGVFTFNDTANGLNVPEPGQVTASEATGIPVNSLVDLEIALDTSGFDPATGSLASATFVGTGPGAELLIWDPTGSTVLLALDIDFIDVTTVGPKPFFDGSFTMGAPSLTQYGLSSQLQVVGGTQAASVGGIGTRAVLEILVDSPVPEVSTTNVSGYLNDSFVVGLPDTPPVGQVDIALTIPEPGGLLLGAAAVLAGLGVARRRAA